MRALPLSATLILLPAAAMAHTGIAARGTPLLSGLAHPILGPDHLLAMIAVGLFAAMTGGRAIWAYPAAFVTAMVAGGFLGFDGAELPIVEPAVLASVIVLGLAIAVALRPPLPVACTAIAAFGLAHGYAHGLEGPDLGGLPYAIGFVIATSALHGIGLALGFGTAAASRPGLSRAFGGFTCAAGLALILG